MARHKHADLIHAWAEGAEIEYKNHLDNIWVLHTSPPAWYEDYEYRIKPKEPEWYENIPDIGVLCWVDDSKQRCELKTKIAVIKDCRLSDAYHFKAANGMYWNYATPLTNEEIERFKR